MPIFELSEDAIRPVPETSFAQEGIYERGDIQRVLRQNIQAIDDSLFVVAEEFANWVDSTRRIDLLCLDTNANLVVVELKRTEDGGHMELQALRYAAMISPMTFDQLVDAHAHWLAPGQPDTERARQAILEFLGWERPDEEQFGRDVRIVLASADFGKELTTTVLWLRDRGLVDIRCVRMRPHRLADGRILLDIQQLIPLPEATSFQTQIGAKQRAARESRNERQNSRYQWWESLLAIGESPSHAGISPNNSPYLVVRDKGLHWSFLLTQHESGAELFMDFGPAHVDRMLHIFDQLHQQRLTIEASFGRPLIWNRMEGNRGCKVTFMQEGGYRAEEERWKAIQLNQVAAMNRLRDALLPHLPNAR